MADVKVGDYILITKYQHAAPEGTFVEVTAVDPDDEFVKYRWITASGNTVSDFYADTGTYELVKTETVPIDEPVAPETVPEDDPVNHPSHYTFGKYEVLDVIEDWGLSYHLGNATKYIARAGRKDPSKEKQDLEKAVFYINRRIAQL